MVTPDATKKLSGSLQVDAGNGSALGARWLQTLVADVVLASPISDDDGFRVSARIVKTMGSSTTSA